MKKKLFLATLVVATILFVGCMSVSAARNSWFYDFMETKKMRIVDSEDFSEDISREEATALLARSADLRGMLPSKKMYTFDESFSNMENLSKKEVKALIERATSVGIVNGYEGHEVFLPKNNITRAEAATILHNYVQYMGIDSKYNTSSNFTDVPNSHWAKPYIDFCEANEYISGYPDGSFRPDRYISIEEFVSILVRINESDNFLIQSLEDIFYIEFDNSYDDDDDDNSRYDDDDYDSRYNDDDDYETRTERPVVDTGSYSSSTSYSSSSNSKRPERPVVDTTDDDDDNTTTSSNSRPSRQVVDTTNDDDDDYSSNRPTVNEGSSTRPTRPTK